MMLSFTIKRLFIKLPVGIFFNILYTSVCLVYELELHREVCNLSHIGNSTKRYRRRSFTTLSVFDSTFIKQLPIIHVAQKYKPAGFFLWIYQYINTMSIKCDEIIVSSLSVSALDTCEVFREYSNGKPLMII